MADLEVGAVPRAVPGRSGRNGQRGKVATKVSIKVWTKETYNRFENFFPGNRGKQTWADKNMRKEV